MNIKLPASCEFRANSYNYGSSYILFLLLIAFFAPLLQATESSNTVVTPAPDFEWEQRYKIEHLSSLLGKPVLLLVTDSPRNPAFRCQLHKLKEHYERMASHGLICAVAFVQEGGAIPSNIPFITVSHGSAVAKAYGLQNNFGLALLGADGNLDCLSTRPLSGQRIDDLMDASYTTQEALRRP